jgi:hypothetical protein
MIQPKDRRIVGRLRTRNLAKSKSVAAAIFTMLGLLLTGCETQADRDRLARDEMKFHTALQEQSNALDDQLHVAQVKVVDLTQGEAAADQLKICFMDEGYDYPRRANLDGSARPIGLSKRVIANCDRIMKLKERYDAKQEAEEKRKDDAYDKNHAH